MRPKTGPREDASDTLFWEQKVRSGRAVDPYWSGMMQIRMLVSCALMAVLAVSFCQGAEKSAAPNDICSEAVATPSSDLQKFMKASQPPFKLATGTSFEVFVYGVKSYDIKARIPPDGKVVLPLTGSVHLGDLTVEQAEVLISDELRRTNMIVSPQVTLLVLDAQDESVAVAGEVPHGGVFSDVGTHTLYELIARAGGFTRSSCHVVTLRRPDWGPSVKIALGADPAHSIYADLPVFPGDSIMVPSAGVIYVVGAFKSQGAYPLSADSKTTVMDAVALAGGVGYEGSSGSTIVVRDTVSGRQSITLNLEKIFKGKQPDIVLEPNDILFVPSNKTKAAIKGGAAGIAAAIASAYIYAAHP